MHCLEVIVARNDRAVLNAFVDAAREGTGNAADICHANADLFERTEWLTIKRIAEERAH